MFTTIDDVKHPGGGFAHATPDTVISGGDLLIASGTGQPGADTLAEPDLVAGGDATGTRHGRQRTIAAVRGDGSP